MTISILGNASFGLKFGTYTYYSPWKKYFAFSLYIILITNSSPIFGKNEIIIKFNNYFVLKAKYQRFSVCACTL